MVTIISIVIAGCINNEKKQTAEPHSTKLASSDTIKTIIRPEDTLNEQDSVIFNAFKQSRIKKATIFGLFHKGGGNCASVAIIKCAISTIGLNKVFKKVDSSENDFIVDLYNGETVSFTKQDLYKTLPLKIGLLQIKKDSLSNKIFSYAKFCFAVMGAELKKQRGLKKFAKAVDVLDMGIDVSGAYKLLGLDTVSVSLANLKKTKNLIIYNSCHAVFSSAGFFDEASAEDNGKFFISPIDSFEIWHTKSRRPDPIQAAYSIKQ